MKTNAGLFPSAGGPAREPAPVSCPAGPYVDGHLPDDRFHDECGIVGIWDHEEAARFAYLGLYALQHRGQESAGIVTSDGAKLEVKKGMGYVADLFDAAALERLTGRSAIGHNRYSTSGDSSTRNIQPIVVSSHRGTIGLCHNGNLINAYKKRRELELAGSIFGSTSDSEVVLHLIARSRQRIFIDAVLESLREVQGAYSFLFLSEDCMVAARDPHGFRPLCIGRLNSSTIFASETSVLDLVGARYDRDVDPGEMIVIDGQGERSYRIEKPSPFSKHCIFEHVYFARPDSLVFGRCVNDSRIELGRQLAREQRLDVDIVVPVPDSGVVAALGYSRESGVPFAMGLVRNHYVGRTFIEPKKSIRNFGVKVKLNPVESIMRGKRVLLLDDSIVRGTTCPKIVAMVRAAGAREVHMGISSPPIVGPCYYGIDTPNRDELIASSRSIMQIRDFIGADTLSYLSLQGLLASVESDESRYCTACFTNRYPILQDDEERAQLKLFDKVR